MTSVFECSLRVLCVFLSVSTLALKTKSKESDANLFDTALQDYAYNLYTNREKKLADFRPASTEKLLSELDAILYHYA